MVLLLARVVWATNTTSKDNASKSLDMQLLVLAQQEHQSSAALLHRHRNRSTGKALTHLRGPSLNGLRHMVHFSALTGAGVGVLQAPDVLLVCPINGQKSGILDFGLVLTHEFFLTSLLTYECVGSFYDSVRVASHSIAGYFVVRNPYSRVMASQPDSI